MTRQLAEPAPRRASPRAIATLLAVALGASAVVGLAASGIASVAGPVAQGVAEEIGNSLERVTADGRVSFLYPKGFDSGVEVSDLGGFRWVSAGGYEDHELRDLEIDNGDDAPDLLWSVLLRNGPTAILGYEQGGDFLKGDLTEEQFLVAAEMDAQLEFEDGAGLEPYETLETERTRSPDGAPQLIATYTWPLSENVERWAGVGATAWQMVTTYTFDGDTTWRLSATGFLTDGANDTLREVATSLRWEGR